MKALELLFFVVIMAINLVWRFVISPAITIGKKVKLWSVRFWRWWQRSNHWIFVGRAILCIVGLHMLVAGYIGWYVFLNKEGVPYLGPFIKFQPPTTGQIYDRNGDVLIEVAKEYREIIHYEDIPKNMEHAILAAEDKDFFEHNGVNWLALLRVAWQVSKHSAIASLDKTLKTHRPAIHIVFQQGGSSIDQQLTRRYFLLETLRQENSLELISSGLPARFAGWLIGIPNTNKLTRKFEEWRLTLYVNQELIKYYGTKRRVKEEILARYASFVYMDSGRYGFAAASEFYFDKPLSDITPDEAALLAGIVKLPSVYSPSRDPEKAKLRRNHVLTLMAQNGFIPREVAEALKNKPIYPPISKQKTIASAVVEHIFTDVKKCSSSWSDCTLDRLHEGHMTIISTADARIQKIAQTALENGINAYEERHKKTSGIKGLVQGAVVVLRNRDAAILAEVGGRKHCKGKDATYNDYNRVSHPDSARQPGSAFKPLVYLTAFRRGWTLDSEVLDIPVSVNMGWGRPAKWIDNYDNKSKGKIVIRRALAESRNQATMWLAKIVGVTDILNTAYQFGIKTELEAYPSVVLGASGVTLLELANAYRAMATGLSAEPYVVQKIISDQGVVYLENKGESTAIDIPAEHLLTIQEGLRGVVRIPGGTAYWAMHDPKNNMQEFPIPVAGKTGTTNYFKDAWFIGFTYGPDGITVAVHLFFDKPSIGFDEKNKFGRGPGRGLGDKEAGAKLIPIFKEIVSEIYGKELEPPWQPFPKEIESGIDDYLGTAQSEEIEKEE